MALFKTPAKIVAVVKTNWLQRSIKRWSIVCRKKLAERQMQPLGYTLAEVQAKALVDTLKERIVEKVEIFYNTVGEVEAEPLVNKMANRIAVIRVKTLGQKLIKVCRVR